MPSQTEFCQAFLVQKARHKTPPFPRTTHEIKVGGRQMHTLVGHSGSVRSVAFSPNGNRVVSGSSDTFVKIWDVATGVEVSCHACTL